MNVCLKSERFISAKRKRLFIFNLMKHDPHLIAIENLLRSIPELERNLSTTVEEDKKRLLQRSLRNREKRFDHLIPFRFRLQIYNICKEKGIKTDLL